jgi:hypothetical protein
MNQLRMFNVDSAPPSTSLSKFVRAVRRSPMGWLFLTEEEAAELVRVDFGGRATVEPLDAPWAGSGWCGTGQPRGMEDGCGLISAGC